MPNTVISVKDVHLRLQNNAGPMEILKGISFGIAAKETVALTGPSGSGKSSLLMILGGLERATSGDIHVLDHDFTRLNEDSLARIRRDHMGIVFQAFHLIPTMTALENVAVPLELAGKPDPMGQASDALKKVGLSHRETHYPSQLSGGEQQRVALARAIAPGPEILLADEPTGNLDDANSRAIIDLLFDLKDAQGATLVLVTHSNTLAQKCDRILGLRDGRLDMGPIDTSPVDTGHVT